MNNSIVVYNSEADKFWDQFWWNFSMDHPWVIIGFILSIILAWLIINFWHDFDLKRKIRIINEKFKKDNNL